ncbi:MFS transporter [Castellaniella caeni]|uniref:MFS transporter n=1 Tax=Castellaniella caeni TaxID=266123 RepID=UPI001CA51E74|nr:MFS transporter [Castellaniella caeni]
MSIFVHEQKMSCAPVSGRYGFIAMALVLVVGMAGTTLPTPLYPLYQQRLGLTPLMVAVVFATYAFAVIATLITTGPWSDQIGRRRILAAGCMAAAASSLLFLVNGGIGTLLVARALSGASAGLLTATATITIVELAPTEQKTQAAVLAAIANMGGLGIGSLLAGTISEYLPWPLHLVYAVHLALLVAAGIVVWRSPETIARPVHPHLHRQRLGLPSGVDAIFIPSAIACFAGFALLGLLTSLEPAILGEIIGISNRASVGALVFLVFTTSLAGQLLQRRLGAAARLPVACAVLAFGAAIFAGSMLDGSLSLLILGALVSGLGQGGVFAASIVALTAASPVDQKAEITSLLFVIIYLAVAIPVLGLGGAIALIGLRNAGVTFALLVTLLSIAALGVLWRYRTRSHKTSTVRPLHCWRS